MSGEDKTQNVRSYTANMLRSFGWNDRSFFKKSETLNLFLSTFSLQTLQIKITQQVPLINGMMKYEFLAGLYKYRSHCLSALWSALSCVRWGLIFSTIISQDDEAEVRSLIILSQFYTAVCASDRLLKVGQYLIKLCMTKPRWLTVLHRIPHTATVFAAMRHYWKRGAIGRNCAIALSTIVSCMVGVGATRAAATSCSRQRWHDRIRYVDQEILPDRPTDGGTLERCRLSRGLPTAITDYYDSPYHRAVVHQFSPRSLD